MPEQKIYQKDLISIISQKTGLPKTKVTKFLNGFKNSIRESLKAGEKVQLKGFATFDLAQHKLRRYYNSRLRKEIIVPAKRTVKFRKSETWELPIVVAPKPKRRQVRKGSAADIKKKTLVSRRRYECEKVLAEVYDKVVADKCDLFPYIWKLCIKKSEYNYIKSALIQAVGDYKRINADFTTLISHNANLFAVYVAEWYKREYKNNRDDEKNDALVSLGLPGGTTEYKTIWQYSSTAFDIGRFLYKTQQTNRVKHSLYILGGVPMQFESTKLRAIIFNGLNVDESEEFDDDESDLSEKNEDEQFLNSATYLRESLTREDGSLCLFIEALREGSLLEEMKKDVDCQFFIDNYIELQDKKYNKRKFRPEWILYYQPGCKCFSRALRISLRGEFSEEKNKAYISAFRLKKWNIPTDNLKDFSIYLIINNGQEEHRLFRYSSAGDYNYVCWNNPTSVVDEIPENFKSARLVLRPDTLYAQDYELPEDEIKFADVKMFFKTANSFEWTDNAYVNSTKCALLFTDKYIVSGEKSEAYLPFDNENGTSKYNLFPFSGSIVLKNKFTRVETEYNSKAGRIDISLDDNKDSLYNTIPNREIKVRIDGKLRDMPLYAKDSENRFRVREYDAQRGIVVADDLLEDERASIIIEQNDNQYANIDGLNQLSYGLFEIICRKGNRKSSMTAFCLESKDDVRRNVNRGQFVFSHPLMGYLGDISPVDFEFQEAPSQHGKVYKEDLMQKTDNEFVEFCSADDAIRIPVYRSASNVYVVFFNGIPELIEGCENNGRYIIYVPWEKRDKITKINFITTSGVRGVNLENVEFGERPAIILQADNGQYDLNLQGDDIQNYTFKSLDLRNGNINRIDPYVNGIHLYLHAAVNRLVVQTTDKYQKPANHFIFTPIQSIDINERTLAYWINFSQRYGVDYTLLKDADGNNAIDWLVGRDVKDEEASPRLPLFFFYYCAVNGCRLSDAQYSFLCRLASDLKFDWMFLVADEWAAFVRRYEGLKKAVRKLLVFEKEDSLNAGRIANAILENKFSKLPLQPWYNHSSGRYNNTIGYMAVEYLMPHLVQKEKKKAVEKVNRKNADLYREIILDPKNKTIARQSSFTGKLYREQNAVGFLEELKDNEQYAIIYRYIKEQGFI